MRIIKTAEGSFPIRGNKNPIRGVIHCFACEGIATVHEAKGKRKGIYYTVCDECGTDQSAGKVRQDKIKALMKPNIEALNQKEAVKEVVDLNMGAPDTASEPEAHEYECSEDTYKTSDPAGIIEEQPEPKMNPKEKQEINSKSSTKPVIFALIGGVCGAVLGLVA